jgi:hypothetical protein
MFPAHGPRALQVAHASKAQVQDDRRQLIAPNLNVETGLAAAGDGRPGLVKGLGENLQCVRIEGLATVEWSALHDISLAMGGESRQASRTGKSVELSQNNLKESFGSMTRSVRKRTDRMRKSCSALSRRYLYHVTVQTSEVASHARRYGGRAESWLSLAATRMGQAPPACFDGSA